MKSLGAGLDTVSIQEVRLGLVAGFEPQDIIYTPNCVGIEEINDAVSLGVRINIDNLSILEQFGTLYHGNYPVCIRVNPHILVGGNDKISVGHSDSKFGISIHQLPHFLRIVKATGLKIEGLHMHTGSDILDATARQVYLMQLLGATPPTYAHVPVLLGSDGQKLSKQNRAAPIDLNTPSLNVCRALRQLGQTVPTAWVEALPAVVLDWAVTQWRPEAIPRQMAITA